VSRNTTLEVAGKGLKLSNLDKAIYPAADFTKGQVIDYYTRIGPVLLPHLKDRPVSLKRYPDGVEGKFFWTKECPARRPAWVRTTAIWSQTNRRALDFCLIGDLPSLIWAANLAAIELHASLSRAADMSRPTALVFDLDPGPPATVVQCARVGLWLREVFEQLGLQAFPKTSGSKGLQVYVPLNGPVGYEQTKPFAHDLALRLEREHPELVVSNIRRSLRAGKVLVDWSQNDEHKTMICVYCLRARTRPTVSTPVTWDEVAAAHEQANPDLLVFDSERVVERVGRLGDLFSPVLRLKQALPTH
jgi:bifunctional non-homologous end joining protein LigD